ncbi:hypothetical protein D3C76_835100 [compost metagenome]
MVGPVVARRADLHHVDRRARDRGRLVRSARFAGGHHHDFRRGTGGGEGGVEVAVVVRRQVGARQARPRRGADQGQAEAVAHARCGRFRQLGRRVGAQRVGEHFHARAAAVTLVGDALDLDRGLRAVVVDLPGEGEQVGTQRASRTGNLQVVLRIALGVEDRTALHLFLDVRVADELLHQSGFRVGLGVVAGHFLAGFVEHDVGSAGTVEERAESSVQGTGVVEGGDADVAGVVDRPPAGAGDGVDVGAVGMADGIHAGGRHRGANTDAGEVVLLAVDDLPFAGNRFQRGDILLDTQGVAVAEAGIGSEPEALARPVVGEDDGFERVEAAFRGNGAHVPGRSRGARSAGTDCLGQAELQRHPVEVLVPHGEPAGGEGVGTAVEILQCSVRTARHGYGQAQRVEHETWQLVHDASWLLNRIRTITGR